MDVSKFKTSDWLIIGGGIGMFVFGTFVDWLKFGPFSDGNAFDFFLTGTVPWLLLIGAAIFTVLIVQDKMNSTSLPWPIIIVFITVLSAVLLLIRLVFNPGVDDGVSRGAGLILSVVSGLVSAVGGVMAYTAGGGDLKDLTDMNKIKGAFDKH